MLVYYIPLIVLFSGYILTSFISKKTYLDNLFFLFSLLIIFIITGFKGNIDPDFNNYKYYFDLILPYNELTDNSLDIIKNKTSHVEIGTIYYISILKYLGLEFTFFYIFISAISTFLTYKISQHFPQNKCIFLFCILCLYVQSYFIISRFLIAVLSIILIILNFNKYRKIRFFDVLIFLIGSIFHSVLYLSIPIVILYHFRKQIIKYYSILLFIPIIVSLIPIEYFYFLFSLLNERYIFYISRDNPGHYYSFLYREMLLLVFYFYLFYFEKYKLLNSSYLDKTLAISMLMLASAWSLAWQLDILYRVTLIFDFGWILFLLVPYKNIYAKVAIRGLVIFYCLLRYYIGINELSNYTFNDFI